MRRILLLGVLTIGLVGGCGTAEEGNGPITWPSGPPQVVASYGNGGGFVPYAWHLLEGPRMVVYSDGRAVADARRTLTLTSAELSDLVHGLRRQLSGLGPTVTARGATQVMDASSVTLRVRRDDQTLQSVSAYALSADLGYPDRLVQARDRLEQLAVRVLHDGAPYTSDRILLVAETRTGDEPAAAAWPQTVALPAAGADPGVRTAVLSGEAAQAVASDLPGQAWREGPWPVLQRTDGARYGVAWRYLTPEE
jgi:hypothetical protein